MDDQEKTRDQLVTELTALRHRVAELEAAEAQQERVEEALRESEERFRKTFDTESVAMAISRRRDGMYLEVNPGFLKITGYDYDEIVGHTSQELAFFSLSQRQALIADLNEHGRLHNRELTFPTREGALRTILFSIGPITLENEECLLATMVDITGRKRAEEALRESEAKIRSILRAAPTGIGLVSHRVLLDVNDRLCEITGYSREELIGNSARMLYPTDEAYETVGREKYRQIAEQGTGTVETKFQRKDGQIIDVLLSSTPLDLTDLSAGVTFTVLDITEFKRAEEALRKSEERFRMTIQRSPIGVGIVDDEGNLTDCNTALAEMIGYSKEELSSLSFEDFTHPDDLEREWQLIEELWDEETTQYRMEKRYIHKDGHTIWVDVAASLFKDERGGLAFGFAFVQDITERWKAEKALRESEERFRTIVNALPQFIAYTDKDLRYRFVNQTYQEKFGVNREDVLGRTLPEIIGQEAFEEARPHLERALRGERVRYHERFDYAIGDTRDIDGILVPDVSADGGVRGYYAVLTDITPYIEMQEALRQSTERIQIQHQIDRAILAAQSAEEIAHAALSRLQDLIPCRRTSIAEIDWTGQQARDLVILVEGELEAKEMTWHPLSGVGQDMIDLIQQGHPHMVRDIAALEAPSPMERLMMTYGVRTYISVPLMVQNTPIGALNMSSETPDFFTADHVEILEKIAASLAIALQQAHLLEQTQRDAETRSLLLREVNHRVLNNLTMIQAILDLEGRRSLEGEADFHAALNDVANRIEGMTIVHRLLSSAQWGPLELSEVVEKVVHAVLQGSPIQPQVEVLMDAPADPLLVTARQAIAVALVVNELTTNSIKYAFDSRSQGRIDVRIAPVDDGDDGRRVRLVFRDDGPGMPETVLAGERSEVGLWLVEANVTHPLNGTVVLHNDDGAVVSITFKRA
jgi:PAS domain S-box-containing protein